VFRTFDEIERHILSSGVKKRIALTGAHDSYSLEAVVHAKRRGLVTAALLGRVDEIAALLRSMDEPQDGYELIGCETEEENARRAVAMVHEGKADMPMKGLLQTSAYMHAVLDKNMGLLPQGGLLSQSTLVEWTKEGRMFQITDCAINIAPDVQQKKKIVENAVRFAHRLGCECPKVAVVSAVEVVNPKIPSTVEAAALKQACRNGELPGCIVGGPLGLDNAVSLQAARHKGVTDPAAGSADILVMPELCAGNIFTKSITFFAGLRSAGVLLGTTTPVIATSRTDTPENKYHGILMSLLNAL
jgi:phosphate butyryltransferase